MCGPRKWSPILMSYLGNSVYISFSRAVTGGWLVYYWFRRRPRGECGAAGERGVAAGSSRPLIHYRRSFIVTDLGAWAPKEGDARKSARKLGKWSIIVKMESKKGENWTSRWESPKGVHRTAKMELCSVTSRKAAYAICIRLLIIHI